MLNSAIKTYFKIFAITLIIQITGFCLAHFTDELLDRIVEELKVLPKQEPIHIEAVDDTKDRTSFEVMRDSDGAFEVVGGLVDNLVRNVVLSDFESNRYFQKQLLEKGVIQALKDEGCEEGDTVRISDIEFDFVE